MEIKKIIFNNFVRHSKTLEKITIHDTTYFINKITHWKWKTIDKDLQILHIFLVGGAENSHPFNPNNEEYDSILEILNTI